MEPWDTLGEEYTSNLYSRTSLDDSMAVAKSPEAFNAEIRYDRLLIFRKTANKPAGGRDAPDLWALCIPGYIAVGW